MAPLECGSRECARVEEGWPGYHVSKSSTLLVVGTTYLPNRWQLLLSLRDLEPRLAVRGIRPVRCLVVVVHVWKDDFDRK